MSRPALRLIGLGASNLVRALPQLIAALDSARRGPIEVLAACGHGRSYGQWSQVFGIRSLPGIRQSALWSALAERPPAPTVALITDVGNDLAYGAELATITDWLERCFADLAAVEARTVVTLPPVAVLEALPSWQFAIARRFLFPGRDLDQPAINRQVRALAGVLEDLAGRSDAALVALEPDWLGLDPIHWHRRGRRAVIDACLEGWRLEVEGRDARRDGVRAPPPRLLGALPAESRWFGRTVRRRQPVRRSADGSTVWLF